MSAKPFQRPEIFDNPIGWGPSTTPAQFDDVPYAPFGKGDKLGKVADWTAAPFGGHQSRFQQRGGYQGGRSSTPTEGGFGYVHEEDEGDFKLVDTSAKSKQKAFRQVQRGRWGTGAGGFRRDRRRGDGRPAASAGARRQQAPRGKRWRTNNRRFGGYGRYGSDQKRALEPSVEVKSDWRLVDQYDFSSLTKLNSEEPPSDDLVTCGSVQVLDKSYSAVSTKTEKPLERIERTFFKVTTSDDPIIRELVMQEGAGNVFATDAILACLMACPRSVYSWDIVIQRVGSKLFFDKRDNSHFDFLTVNETAHDMLYDDKDGINSPANLSEEATFINQNFSQQILQNEKDPLQRPNPFQEGEEDDDIPVASTGYRYRRFHLNDEVDLVVRCEVDAVLPKLNPEASRQYVTIKALNEYEPKPGVEWRQKLDTQRGAVLATELKNNAFKLAQWCAQSILAGSDQFVLGYVSRVNPKDSYNHTILGLQSYKPTEFANQINLNIRNMWGILKGVIDTCMQLPEGKFLLLKDPNKAMMSLYAVPQDAFDDLDDDTEASDELIEDEAELEEDETDDENYA